MPDSMLKTTRTAALLVALLLAACGPDSPPPGVDPVCGDGTVDPGEACDDGNLLDGDGCSATCSLTAGSCGDGTVDPGEACDDGNVIDEDDCTVTCALARCGDGFVQAGIEECDDGNLASGDGCDSNCKLSEGPEVVTCAELAPLAGGTTCAATAGDGTLLVIGNVLVPGKVWVGGEVLVGLDGRIACVGCDCAASAPAATRVTCPAGVISPGLINPHDHITFTQNAPAADTGERYEHRHDWRRGIRGHTEINSAGGASPAQVSFGELRFLFGGATSTVGSGAAAGLVRNLDRGTEQEGLGQDSVHFETFPLGDSNGLLLSSGCGYPGIDTLASISSDDAYLPHVAEGIDRESRNEFICLSSGGGGGQDLVQQQSAFIHSIGLTAPDYAALAVDGTAVIWSPRSNIVLYGDTAQVTTADRLGVEIALGTDWMPTGSMNLLRELACADELNRERFGGHFTDEDLWLMVTRSAASATGTADVVGTLAVGMVADLAIFDGSLRTLHRAVIEAEPTDVALVLRGGKALHGDDAIVGTLRAGASCDAFDLCGVAKRVCLADEIGMSLAALEAAAGGAAIYPAYFCGAPDSEPSCVPRRPNGVAGSTVYTGELTAGDTDGDGLANALDLCPTVFSPIRPLDAGAQADHDLDGVGDPCDVCPLHPNVSACDPPDPADLDADGIPDTEDNCPAAANPDQADADGDAKGDACDSCPIADPGTTGCPRTIYDVKLGVAPLGSRAAITGALCTGRNGNGFFVQVKETDIGYLGADNSGLFVYSPLHTVVAGDRVDLAGTVNDFFGQTQLGFPEVTVRSSFGEAPPLPTVETPAAVATGGARADALESVLVRVEAVSVTDIAPAPGPGDVPMPQEFVVSDGAGALRVNDLLYLVTPFPVPGETFGSITGVLDFRNGNSKLEPRDAGDFIPGVPVLAGLEPASGTFLREGDVATATFPTPLVVRLERPAPSDTFVTVMAGDPAIAVPAGGATVLAGQSQAVVLLDGVTVHAGVTLTATLGPDSFGAVVRVLGVAETPALVSLTPTTALVAPTDSLTLTATVDFPAPPGGTVITIAVDPPTAGMVPASITVPEGALAASFDYVDDGTATGAMVYAMLDGRVFGATITIAAGGTSHLTLNEVDYDQTGTDTAEFVELLNLTGGDVSLAGLALVFVNGSAVPATEYERIDLGPAGTLAAGQFLVVAPPGVTIAAGALRLAMPALTGNIQNGAPDGVLLIDTATNTVLDALSYEGSILEATVTGFAASVSCVEGTPLAASVADTAGGSLGRAASGADSDDHAADWALHAVASPGAPN